MLSPAETTAEQTFDAKLPLDYQSFKIKTITASAMPAALIAVLEMADNRFSKIIENLTSAPDIDDIIVGQSPQAKLRVQVARVMMRPDSAVSSETKGGKPGRYRNLDRRRASLAANRGTGHRVFRVLPLQCFNPDSKLFKCIFIEQQMLHVSRPADRADVKNIHAGAAGGCPGENLFETGKILAVRQQVDTHRHPVRGKKLQRTMH